MMMAECKSCGAPDSVDYEEDVRDTCVCDECGARFDVEPSADFDGESYVDDSVPGKLIEGGADSHDIKLEIHEGATFRECLAKSRGGDTAGEGEEVKP